MTFLFDIGKVLVNFNIEKSLSEIVPPEHPNHDEAIATVLNARDHFESGKMDGDEFARWAADLLRTTPEAFVPAWCEIFTKNEPMWRVVEKLAAKGHTLLLFSNTNPLHWEQLERQLAAEFTMFHGAVISYKVGVMKPHEDIYHHTIRHYGLDPAEVIYIDDLEPNIVAGKAAGFTTFQYDIHNHDEFVSWLEPKLS